MFSEQTEREICAANAATMYGGGCVLSAWAFRELVDAARNWDAAKSGAGSSGAWIALAPGADGNVEILAGNAGVQEGLKR